MLECNETESISLYLCRLLVGHHVPVNWWQRVVAALVLVLLSLALPRWGFGFANYVYHISEPFGRI